ncbi:unnamed protein product (macronuclear) [Paramecium tetraurelia]|uniref:Uncharacterized protein n=1 Tax=Paramecium tetraurelia TaxID=5888 RepID=A0DLU4_PARTE|nr:uncharacterized protein GSPATT00039643001 [Paramecium tetraurelia]CAK84011.1 unnamed protein product [Paramecium tetraurelia]|eukprot:XP_001451408.1 hypothetical protein (macronuclear) [Paramecium tetraurelia strain d4-2]
MYPQLQKEELVEFRNYIREVTSAKINKTTDKTPKRNNAQKQLEFILKSTQLRQTVQKPENTQQLSRLNYESSSYIPRSSSQPFVQFDSNCWKETQNSFSKQQTAYVSVSDMLRITNGFNQMNKKDISALNSNYLHSLHELDLTITALLKRID